MELFSLALHILFVSGKQSLANMDRCSELTINETNQQQMKWDPPKKVEFVPEDSPVTSMQSQMQAEKRV